MNTYEKYRLATNVWLAKTTGEFQRGDEIKVTNRYGQEKAHIIHNLVYTKNGFYYYSITRADGYNAQTKAIKKAEKLEQSAASAVKKGEAYFTKADKDRGFLALCEPIKVGHHSERRHRKAFEDRDRNMRNAVESLNHAEDRKRRAEYWASRADEINLSMPESIEYYVHKLEEAREHHALMKNHPEARPHSMSLSYASKQLKVAIRNAEQAVILWGDQPPKSEPL